MKGNTEPPIAGHPLERVGHLFGGETDAGNGRDEVPRVRIREAMPSASTELGPPAEWTLWARTSHARTFLVAYLR